MKINHKDLERLYKDYIRQKVPLSRENCPKTKDIVNCFDSQFSKQKKTKIIDHITDCIYCLQEFDFILQSLRVEKTLFYEIYSERKKKEKANFSTKKSFLERLSWNLVPLVIGAAIVVIGGIILIKNDLFLRQEKREVRGIIEKIILLEPVNQIRFPSPSLFRWHDAEASDYYILEIFDKALNPFWKSPKILGMQFVAPPALFEQMNKNMAYYWMITSFRNDEKHDESSLQKFLLKD